jgi:hypothetical protein
MFAQLVDSVISTPDLRSFMDVLCKGTSGAAAADISAAYMVRAFAEMYQPGAVWECDPARMQVRNAGTCITSSPTGLFLFQ